MLTSNLPKEQQEIWDRCYHPTGIFIRFENEDVEQSIPSRFEQQVSLYPDNLAIKTDSEELTYKDLNEAADQVAVAVVDQTGFGAEPIGLLFDQDTQAITAILGALKAGKIFVPLDPSQPIARISTIVDEVQARLLLTDSHNSALAEEFSQDGCKIINIDALGDSKINENPGYSILPGAIAYIAYTSGSTGQPKGVIHTHRNILHAVMRNTNVAHICSSDRLSLLYAPGGVAGLGDIFRALLNGAAVCAFNLKANGAEGLANWMIQNEVTIYHSVPTAFRQNFANLSEEQEFPKLRHIYLGGEPVRQTDIDLYARHSSPDCIFAIVMGSTEAHISRWFFVDGATQLQENTAPLGYDILQEQNVLLLDENGGEVGFDTPGQIAIKSRYLSPGYWRRPDLTQATFLEDPNGGDERIYLSGDLALMRPDGCLLFLGRMDSQVKIRGHRVELAEIESVLLSTDLIKEAVVTLYNDPSMGPRLVAYIVPIERTPPTVTDLRRLLGERLPEYMIPSAFMVLDSLPFHGTGKVDSTALPIPGPDRPNLSNPWVGPRTPVEESLVMIWSEVLRLDQVGIHDNFLELGGHSLLATQVVSRVIGNFRVDVPLRSVFDSPTIADMAVVITQHLANRAEPGRVEQLLSDLETRSNELPKQTVASDSQSTERIA